MRSARLSLLLVLMAIGIPVRAQQSPAPLTPSTPSTIKFTLPPATKDAQAVSVVNQALTAAGGLQAITAITDYAGTGTITYYNGGGHDEQNTVTARAIGLNKFRLDTTTSKGVRSDVTNGPTWKKDENGVVHKAYAPTPLAPARLVLPYLQLKAALTSKTLNLVYKGVVEVDGHPAQDIQIQHIFPTGPDGRTHKNDALNVDFFIDSSTLQIVIMQDFYSRYLLRQIRYSDFKTVGGVLVPFSISESVTGHTAWLMQFSQVTFNSGQQDLDFNL